MHRAEAGPLAVTQDGICHGNATHIDNIDAIGGITVARHVSGRSRWDYWPGLPPFIRAAW